MRKRALIAIELLLFVTFGATTFPNCPLAPIQNQQTVYVPRVLDDCFVQLEKIRPRDEIEKMKNGTEKDMIEYHFGPGLWIRNNWGLWGNSRLAKWFKSVGIDHADDMSGIILSSFWRHLNGKPIGLGEQVQYYRDYWRRIKKQK